MADDADRAADLDARLAAARVPAEPVMFFSCFPVEEKRPRKVVLASFAPQWTAAGWKVVGDAGPGKAEIEWPGEGEPVTPGGARALSIVGGSRRVGMTIDRTAIDEATAAKKGSK